MTDAPVLIVGAGPTGLALALVLTKLGVRVRLIDATAEAAPYSRALGVHARTLEFYRQLGIADAVVAGGVRVQAVNLWVARAQAARVPLGDIGKGLTPYPFVLDFAQDAHERLLIERLDGLGVEVERRTRLLRFEQDGDRVRATLERPGGSEERHEAAYLAGCDGARSAVREGLAAGFPGGTYSRLFYVADVEAAGPAANGELHVDLDSDDLLAIFAMKGAGHIRLVGTVRREPMHDDRALTFADVSPRIIEQMQLAISKVNWFSTYRVHHRVADRFRSGRAFLLGDAAHIHSPVGAQGMNTGIGDAVNLAWKLAAVVKGDATSALLDTYEIERRAFARRLVATTDRAFVIASSPGRIAAFVRTRIFPTVVPALLRTQPARRLLFRTISQIGIEYRASPLSAGAAGAVRGGDRLPWVPSARTSNGLDDNFTPLASWSWQLHVYGEPRDGVVDACAQFQLRLHTFAWSPAMKQSGLARGAIYLVRPDGYVALADADGDPSRLREYFATAGASLRARSR